VTPSRRTFLKATGLAAGALVGAFGIDHLKDRTPPLLHPPGAPGEEGFLAACIRCGQCVEACPPQILHLASAEAGAAMGAPYFVAREKPCDLCQGRGQMECIAVCPTGALAPLARRRDVRIGVAEIDHDTCLPRVGVACKACWHACPFPNEAITFDTLGRAVVVEDACVGCGLCEYVCLTDPTSIRVRPHTEENEVE